jgi:glycosyltransferase involved in cell wall biosynthesis
MIPSKNIKIAYLVASNTLSGGLRVICQQAEELSRRGYPVSLVCPDPQPEWCILHFAQWNTSSFQSSEVLENADIHIATFWSTVSSAVRHYKGPVLHLCQGYEADFSFYDSVKGEIESAYAKSTHKLAVSPHVAARLQTLGYAPVTDIGQTFDPLEFPPSESRCFGDTEPTILLVGIFEADVKGIREALMALDLMKRAGVKFRLTRVSPYAQSQEEIAIFPADNYFVHIPTKQMACLYREANLFIGPSHAEEGFGLPVLESLSSGLPVVLSDTPAHQHIARSAAEFFKCSNICSLAESVSSLLVSEKRQRILSRMGPIEANRFRTSDVIDNLIAVFSKYLKRRYVQR